MSIHSTSTSTNGAVERAASVAALAILAVHAGFGVGAPLRPSSLVVAVAALGVAGLAAWARAGAARAIAWLVALLVLVSLAPVPWQAMMAIALGLLALGAHHVGEPLPRGWSAAGRPVFGWAAAIGSVTPIALVAWLALFDPSLADVRAHVPALPVPVLVGGAVGFSIVNAALEEAIWRGVVQVSLTRAFGATLAIVLQAASFGLEHAHGIPRGPVGVLLAFVWALMLGWLRKKSGGLLAPFLAHVVADATIAVIVLQKL